MLRIALLLPLVVALLALQPVRAEDPKPAAAAASAEKGKSPLGRKIGEFTLKDHSGRAVSLADFKDRKLVVVAFLGVECPLAKLYAPRLKKLAEEFDPKGVGFVAIDANCQDSVTEIAAYARRHELAFPVLKDLGNHVADQMGAERTPEVFLLDGGTMAATASSATGAASTISTASASRGTRPSGRTCESPSKSCWPASPSASPRPSRPAAISAACSSRRPTPR